MTSEVPTYMDVTVELIGRDSNVFNLIGLTKVAIRKKHGAEAARRWAEEAIEVGERTESYDHVLDFIMRTVNVT